jgi:hypothetical protein
VVQHHLALGPLQNVLLHAAARHKAVDVDQRLLADAVGARHRLQVVLRVPVRVEDDDGVGCGQVDAQPARPRGQQEGKVAGVWRVEVLHGLVAQLGGRGAVEALVLVAAQAHVV